ncbi:MAG TPA: hypothetical protein VGE88_05320 [Lysobacter sp.]
MDMRVYLPDPSRRSWPGQHAVVETLASAVRQAWASDRPAILAPFHYLSQYANIAVCDALRRELGASTLAVVSGVPENQLGDDADIIPDFRILHTSAEDFRQQMGLSVVKALRRERLLVVFADVPPFALGGQPRETTAVTMGGRPARIFNGVFRLGGPLRARLIPFYLRYTGSDIVGHVLPPIDLDQDDSRQRLADTIEVALRHNHAQWLPAGHPSLYWFSPSR